MTANIAEFDKILSVGRDLYELFCRIIRLLSGKIIELGYDKGLKFAILHKDTYYVHCTKKAVTGWFTDGIFYGAINKRLCTADAYIINPQSIHRRVKLKNPCEISRERFIYGIIQIRLPNDYSFDLIDKFIPRIFPRQNALHVKIIFNNCDNYGKNSEFMFHPNIWSALKSEFDGKFMISCPIPMSENAILYVARRLGMAQALNALSYTEYAQVAAALAYLI